MNDDPRTDPLALELDSLLANFHKAVWDGAERHRYYDDVGIEEAEAIQAYCRRLERLWQPILEAPRDGRRILLSLGRFNGKRIVMIGRWTEWFRTKGDWYWELEGGGRRSDGPDPKPDGWMELPE